MDRLTVAVCLLVWVGVGATHAHAETAREVGDDSTARVRVVEDAESGQFDFFDGEHRVLRYNYRSVEPSKPYLAKVNANNRKYAVARSNYIHPLYGLDGEELTYDWSVDHPHHRGIYWAWPEVQYGGELGDIHALQRVFARPTGKVETHSGEGWVELEAENRWLWEDEKPIVHEKAVIRVWQQNERGRLIDLTYRFVALEDGVTLARRGTQHYGGLNIRMSPVRDMELLHHADAADAPIRRAWSDSVGIRAGGTEPVGFAVFERRENPDYPGDYIEYPYLPWFQPTFPKAGTRFALAPGQPLELRYRLWIRRGGRATQAEYAREWYAFNPAAAAELQAQLSSALEQLTAGKPDTETAAMRRLRSLINVATGESLAKLEQRLLGLLSGSASVPVKQNACRLLKRVGSGASVDALAGLLGDARLAHLARYALEPIRTPAADAALRERLGALEGGLAAGVIDLIGRRRDAAAIGALRSRLYDSDRQLVEATLSTLGKIATKEAAAALRDTTVPTELTLAHRDALLVCAERLAAAGDAETARPIFARVWNGADLPTHLRIGGLRGLALIDPAKAADMLLGALTGSDPRLRLGALQIIRQVPRETLTPPLLAALPKMPVEPLAPAITGPRSLAHGRPVDVSVNSQGSSTPDKAVDGDPRLRSFWSGDDTPATLTVDLGSAVEIDRVHVIFYWDGSRYYQYEIEVSEDGSEWTRVVDQSENTTVSRPAGFDHEFAKVSARYVRVEILKNSANPGAHIVELEVWPPGE